MVSTFFLTRRAPSSGSDWDADPPAQPE